MWRTRVGMTVAALAALAVTGGAAAGADETLDSFDGTCALQGTVHFTPPVTYTDAAVTYAYDANGTCTPRDGGAAVPVTLHHAGPVYGSCQSAHTTAPGSGEIGFGGEVAIGYTLEFTDTLTETDMTMSGQRSGTAHAHGTFLTQRTPPDVAAKC